MKKQTTLFGELIQNDSKIEVVCQTDKDYSYVANQCSWCSSQFIHNREKLIASFFNDKQAFAQIYSDCIAVGTELRSQYGYIPCGENADNQKMLQITKIQKLNLAKFTYSENDYILQQIAPSIPSFALQEFNSRKHVPLNQLRLPEESDFIMLGRHGQTFVVFPLKQKYLVLDSHVHECGIMNKENLIKYIKLQTKGPLSYGYLFVTIVAGKQ